MLTKTSIGRNMAYFFVYLESARIRLRLMKPEQLKLGNTPLSVKSDIYVVMWINRGLRPQ